MEVLAKLHSVQMLLCFTAYDAESSEILSKNDPDARGLRHSRKLGNTKNILSPMLKNPSFEQKSTFLLVIKKVVDSTGKSLTAIHPYIGSQT